MTEFLQICLNMPVVPFTVLLGICALYWTIVIVGAIDMQLFDVDLNIDLDGDSTTSVVDWGLISLRWFNLGDVPLMFWLSAFAISAWGAAMFLDRDLTFAIAREGVNVGNDTLLLAIGRTVFIGVFAAKVLTQPLKGRLKHKEPNPASELVGQLVRITSSQVTTEFGQAEYTASEGAPLKLHVRASAAELNKGDIAQIVDYSPDKKLFYVAAPLADGRET